jgi:hypothetical protein
MSAADSARHDSPGVAGKALVSIDDAREHLGSRILPDLTRAVCAEEWDSADLRAGRAVIRVYLAGMR